MSYLPDSFYWFDYETFGIDPALDRPSQFAGLRTDKELNPVGEPLLVYNRLTQDYLPDPDACLLTGISPDTVAEKGLAEHLFIDEIHRELSTPGSCNVGYNNIRFDDEFTRHALFRNFHDPYAHEWQHGNSRWDLLDIVRMTRALRPQGINWPFHTDEQGQTTSRPSNRLEDLSAANGIEHGHAHDALADVYATLGVARLLRDKHPKLFDYALKHRGKAACRDLLDVDKAAALVHISGMIPSESHHLAIIVPLAHHPVNSNGIVVFNLMSDPGELLELTKQGSSGTEEIALRLFTRNSDLPEGTSRLPLKTVHINKTPVLAQLNVIRAQDAERLNIDLPGCERNRQTLAKLSPQDKSNLRKAIREAMQSQQFGNPENVDATLYSGAFFAQEDKAHFSKIRSADATLLTQLAKTLKFEDTRLQELLFRYRARNFPETLDGEERLRWLKQCRDQITTDQNDNRNTFPRTLISFRQALQSEQWRQPQNTALKESLLRYADELESNIN